MAELEEHAYAPLLLTSMARTAEYNTNCSDYVQSTRSLAQKMRRTAERETRGGQREIQKPRATECVTFHG